MSIAVAEMTAPKIEAHRTRKGNSRTPYTITISTPTGEIKVGGNRAQRSNYVIVCAGKTVEGEIRTWSVWGTRTKMSDAMAELQIARRCYTTAELVSVVDNTTEETDTMAEAAQDATIHEIRPTVEVTPRPKAARTPAKAAPAKAPRKPATSVAAKKAGRASDKAAETKAAAANVGVEAKAAEARVDTMIGDARGAQLYKLAMTNKKAKTRGTTRKLTDAELTGYIAKVIEERPGTWAGRELEIAAWVEEIAITRDRFLAAFDAAGGRMSKSA